MLVQSMPQVYIRINSAEAQARDLEVIRMTFLKSYPAIDQASQSVSKLEMSLCQDETVLSIILLKGAAFCSCEAEKMVDA